MNNKKILVTKPFSPPIEEYETLLQGIWQRNWFTNNGPLVKDLELKLKEYLGLKHLLYVTNGTIAIQIALKALGITKKVITTPFSYVATTSSLLWEDCTPIFVDINSDTLNIDPTKIEGAIDEHTEAILATHCFGNPCDIDSIDKIAKKHNLKVIYDAAHCFGTTYKGKSVFTYGDVSTVSFHATKLYHTIEGGAIIVNDKDFSKSVLHMRNFGHDGPENFFGIGINGKNSEFHAAMGLLNLRYIDDIMHKRKSQYLFYKKKLEHIPLLRFQDITTDSSSNHSYFPLIFKDEMTTLLVMKKLEESDIFTRRYFYPSLNKIYSQYNNECPTSQSIANRILCLPLFFDLLPVEQKKVVEIIITQF